MRVGVHLALGSAAAGGGYRFQDDVFAAFLDAAPDSPHTFVVFCDADLARGIAQRLPQNVSIRSLVDRSTGRSRLTRRLPFFRRYTPKQDTLSDYAARDDVAFMWFVSAPGHVVDIPYVAVVWDLQHRSHPWFPEVSHAGQWDHRERVYSAVLGRAAAVIVGTEVGKAEVQSFFNVPPGRITILPHPTPEFALKAPKTNEDVARKFGLSIPFVLYPAQFWPHKNHVNLLLAVEELRRRFNLSVQVALVGSDQGNRAHVEDWIKRLDLAGQVRMLGFVDQSDLIGLYRSCLALTYVSFCGPENLPPLEAFALGCPVIAADIPGSREQLGDAAILVSPDEPRAIAAAIKRLADEPSARRELIERGRLRAGRFTAKDFVSGVFSIIGRFEAVRRTWGRSA